ncbi:hypothetical protein ACFVVQ_22730 [Paenibacillus chitinolyticus]|uniref:hypothetical protein n=1 Tax=Paenibacillus TaxID=44249 RepID=UPI001C443172|nr:hypothetical protein [Paenibacillus chitinolyticus]MBV6714161.1 hypothetical protein [Paenibacillus chitinolyticus]
MWLKIIWVVAIVINIVSVNWFLIGATANFQRSLDLIATVTLIFIWIPSIALTVLSIVLLKKGWMPSSSRSYVGFILGVIILLLLSVSLFRGVDTQGWLTERITSDSLKLTSDKKYEYRIDLINVFQKNSHARLYIKNVSTGEEMNIAVNIQTNKMVSMGIEHGRTNDWVLMERTDISGRYNLYTTKDLRVPSEKFEIDVETGTSRRLE